MFSAPATTSVRRCATLCDDGDECTIDEQDDCETNGCRPTEERLPRDCFLGDCYENACDPEVGCLNGPLAEGDACDDELACTDNACDGAGACVVVREVSDCCTWPDTENRCGSTFCNGRYCDDVLGTDRDTCKAVDPLPCLADDGLSCTVEFCDKVTQACAVNEADDLCADPNICTTAGCSQSGPPPSGCVYETVIELCPLGDACHPLVGCDPAPTDEGGGCQYGDLGPDCCLVDTDCAQDQNQCTRNRCIDNQCVLTDLDRCPEGYSCVEADGSCEPDQPDCFSLTQHQGFGAELIPLCVDDCVARAGCPAGVCEAKATVEPFATLTQECIGQGIPESCEELDQAARDNGCTNICPPPEPEQGSCPCWDGGFQSIPGVTSLADLWQQLGPDVCDESQAGGDRCQDIRFGDGTTLSRAQCTSPVVGRFETEVRDAQGPWCQVRGSALGPRIGSTFLQVPGLTPQEYQACLQEHDEFTDGVNLDSGNFYENNVCGLDQQ